MRKSMLIGCLFSCFLILSIPLIPSVQSIEIKKQVKSVIKEKMGHIIITST